MVASSTNSGVLEAVNATKTPYQSAPFTTLLERMVARCSDDDPDVPRHVSWSGPSIRWALTLRARRLKNGCGISAAGTFSTITLFPVHGEEDEEF
ncbi:hypothetical protein MRX96_029549 [Rhipicephalus microplus]